MNRPTGPHSIPFPLPSALYVPIQPPIPTVPCCHQPYGSDLLLPSSTLDIMVKAIIQAILITGPLMSLLSASRGLP